MLMIITIVTNSIRCKNNNNKTIIVVTTVMIIILVIITILRHMIIIIVFIITELNDMDRYDRPADMEPVRARTNCVF